MTKYSLKAEKRVLRGKKLSQLRKKGIVPGNLFGKGLDSQSVQFSGVEFDKVYKQAGETGIIYVKLDGEDKERPVLVSGITAGPVTGKKLHVDLHQVNLKEKVTAHVPVEFTGEPELVASGQATVITSLDEIEIEALPTDIPENFTINLADLKEIGAHVKVSDLKVEEGVEIKTDLEQTIVALAELQKEVVEETPVTEEAETAAPATETPAAAPSESK